MNKKWIFFIGMMLFMIQAVHSQEVNKTEVPESILKKFSKDFKKNSKDKWTKFGTDYMVDFEDANGVKNNIIYNSEGKISTHKINVPIKDLPEEVHSKSYGIPIIEANVEILKSEKIYELLLEGGEYIYVSIKK